MNKKEIQCLKKLPSVLFELRTQNGWTQTDVAEKLRIKYQSYQAYELGISVPSLQNFIALAELYDVSLDFLIGKKEI
jgi:transcriptional regulator with XRE-family HTH domain